MNPSRPINLSFLLLLIPLSFTACRSIDEESIEISVALTQTAAVEATDSAAKLTPEATEKPTLFFEGDLQPLDIGDCEALSEAMHQALAVRVDHTSVPVQHENKTGGGCQAIAEGSGLEFTDMMRVEDAMGRMLAQLGWLEDPAAPACLGTGGWGPGASAYCYQKAAALCESFIRVNPVEPSLCSDDEPITVCFDQLTPEQILYTITLTCAQDINPPMEPLDSELMRIEFEPGAIQAIAKGEVPAHGFDHYVLTAMENQEMTVKLLDLVGNPLAPGTAALVIWGEDGTVLSTSHSEAVDWVGVLPMTQDYFIDVISISDQSVSYTLEVIIPPPPTAEVVFPKIEPFPFGEMQSIVFTGVPPILPAEFPFEEGLPEIVAYLLTTDDGEYELTLDYGVDCHGAGACHYGSMAGMRVSSDVPTGTSTFPFDMVDAQVTSLAHGITGYFVEAVCGASCDDGRMWWVYQGYQYMLGLKAGSLEQVRALVDAAIENSVP